MFTRPSIYVPVYSIEHYVEGKGDREKDVVDLHAVGMEAFPFQAFEPLQFSCGHSLCRSLTVLVINLEGQITVEANSGGMCQMATYSSSALFAGGIALRRAAVISRAHC